MSKGASAPRPTVADILRDHAPGLRLGDQQQRVVNHIVNCRTAALGGHVGDCDTCGVRHYAYHSCRDRHCPRCGTLDQFLWAEAQLDHLLPVPYFHVAFTVPKCLRSVFGGAGRAPALGALFAASSETLLDLGLSRLHAQLGTLAVLHTWNQKLEFHPHIHCLVPGGGLADGKWVHRRSFLLKVDLLKETFRGKLLQKLRALLDSGAFDGARHAVLYALEAAARQEWNVHVKRTLAGPEQVIKYFARYVRRIAISNSRILDYDGKTVTFTWRDRSDGNKVKKQRLEAPVFARRFVSHILPPRFVRIRRYGILSNRARRDALPRCIELITGQPAVPPTSRTRESRADACLRIFGRDPSICPACQKGRLVPVATLDPDRASAFNVRSRGP